MLRGLYISAAGMSQQPRFDVITNNLANTDTVGFKRDQCIISSTFNQILLVRMRETKVEQVLGHYDLTGRTLTIIEPDYTEGEHLQTKNPLDLALSGQGFFVLETPEGIRYTRNGSFDLDPTGTIITKEGHALLGENGPIVIPADNENLVISDDGTVYCNNQVIDKIKRVDFNEKTKDLIKTQQCLWKATDATKEMDSNAEIKQGFLESSNVNIIKEMIAMIEAERAYNFDQKVLTSFDEILSKAINEIGRI